MYLSESNLARDDDNTKDQIEFFLSNHKYGHVRQLNADPHIHQPVHREQGSTQRTHPTQELLMSAWLQPLPNL